MAESWYLPTRTDKPNGAPSWYQARTKKDYRSLSDDENPPLYSSLAEEPRRSRFPSLWPCMGSKARQQDDHAVARMADRELRNHMRLSREQIKELEHARWQCHAMIKELQIIGHLKQIERIRGAVSDRNTIFLIDAPTFSGEAWNSVGDSHRYVYSRCLILL